MNEQENLDLSKIDVDAYFKERQLSEVFGSSNEDSFAQTNDFNPSYDSEEMNNFSYSESYDPYGSYISNAPELESSDSPESGSNNKAVNELLNYYQQKEFALKNDLYFTEDEPDLMEQALEENDSATNLVSTKNHAPLKAKITLDSSNKLKDEIRFYLACDCYSPKEIYGDDSYFKEVSESPLVSYHDNFEFLQIKNKNLLQSAYHCEYIQSRDVAFIDYLQRHFPLANDYEQQVFNLVLLSLFSHMEEGDICINLSSLQDIYDTIEQWDIKLEELNKRDEECQDLRELLLLSKYYTPDSKETLFKILHRAIAVGGKEESNSPLVFDLNRLYLRRYYNYEVEVANYITQIANIDLSSDKLEQLRKLIGLLFVQDEVDGDLNWQKVAASMASTSKFTVISGGPGTGKTTTVLRIILMLICLDVNKSHILLCAPTGKAAARMSESILMQLKDEQTKITIEKLSQNFGISAEKIKSLIPTEAVTVHSLIKTVPNKATPIYNKDNRLICDVVVVDEVSMLDLALFAKLINAMPDNCKLILLGDKDQLSSVEAGSVLSDLCYKLNLSTDNRISQQSLENIEAISGYSAKRLLSGKIANHVALLQFSYRSKDVPQIGKLAKLVNEPLSSLEEQQQAELQAQVTENIDSYLTKKQLQRVAEDLESMSGDSNKADDKVALKTQQVMDEFAQDQKQAISLNLFEDFMLSRRKSAQSYLANSEDLAEKYCINFAKSCVERGRKDNYAPFLEYLAAKKFTLSTDPKELEHVFKLMDLFRVLCSNHNGEFGDQKINELIEQEVCRTYLKRLIPAKQESFFPGKIVLITANDKDQGFVNGYVGFCAYIDDGQEVKDRSLKVIIPKGIEEVDGQSIMTFNIKSTMMLNNYDSGFAMSIHKSQGSEYDKVSILLSKNANRVLNKELLYTGITRAKKQVEVLGTKASLSCALANSVQRRSGLVERLN